MITNLWGCKVGMTQIFSVNKAAGVVKATPVTIIDCNGWRVVGLKQFARDGYDAVKVGLLRKKYLNASFSDVWLQSPKQYFSMTREIKLEQPIEFKIGSILNVADSFIVGQKVDVQGVSKGIGFAGVYKRHGFGGAAKSHGSMMGRRPGSIGFTRSSGEIMRGQKMAGHKGVQTTTIQNLVVVGLEQSKNVLLVQGSVPGKAHTIVFVKKNSKG